MPMECKYAASNNYLDPVARKKYLDNEIGDKEDNEDDEEEDDVDICKSKVIIKSKEIKDGKGAPSGLSLEL